MKMIANSQNKIRATKEIGYFNKQSEENDFLHRVLISHFSAGKWMCQKHDQGFAGIDKKQIDLSDLENLFKAVYRVVLHQNLLTLSKW